jgi:hypothetical protein
VKNDKLGRRKSDSECPSITAVPEKGEHRRGDFTADYIFWDSEKHLHALMQHHVRLLFMGEEQYQDAWNDSRWVNSIVLRPIHELGQDVVFERIGWLRYSIEEQFKDWEPLGRPHTTFTFI